VGGVAALWRAIAGATLCQFAVMVARPTISYRALQLGAGELEIGVLVAAYAVVPLVVALAMGRLAGRARHVAGVPLGGALALLVGLAVAALAPDLVMLGIASALIGFGNLAVLLGAQSWISRSASSSQYDAGFGWLTAGMSLGQAAGPLVAGFAVGSSGFAGVGGTSTAFWTAFGIAVLVALCFLTSATPRRSADEGVPLPAIAILRRPGVLSAMLVSVALLTSVDILAAYLPVVGERSGIPPELVGALLAVRGMASAASRLLLGPLTRLRSRAELVIASTAGGAVTLLVVAVSDAVGVLFVAMACGGFLIGLGQPLTMSLVALAVPREARSEALAIRLVGNRVGQTLIPLGAGGLAAVLGVAGVFWLQCGLLAIATVTSAISARGTRRGPAARG
jgi:MFS family permease